MMQIAPVIKFNPDTRTRTGFMRTPTEKFYLGEDGILTIVPIGSAEGIFCGLIKGNIIKEVPNEFKTRVEKNTHNLIRMMNAIKENLI